MQRKFEEITQQFNESLNYIDYNKLRLYLVFLDYKQKTCRLEQKILRQDSTDAKKELENINNEYLAYFQQSKISQTRDISTFEELLDFVTRETIEITDLMESYKKAIKESIQDANSPLYSVSTGKYTTLKRSENILNQFEREIGNWVFASSSSPLENVYCLRDSRKGMYRLSKDTYIIFGNHLQEHDNRLINTNTSYMYSLKSDKFSPVVTISFNDKTNSFQFLFDNEWTSEQDIDINDILDISEISDVTNVLLNNQILSTDDNEIILMITSPNIRPDQKQDIIRNAIDAGQIKYWNKELHAQLTNNVNDSENPTM